MESFANTPQGKAQAKRLVECRLALGCTSAMDFYNRYGKGKSQDGKDLFSYPQYQKYESGERLLSQKAAIQFAQIFKKDWEWLQNGEIELNTPQISEDFSNLSDEEKALILKYRKLQAENTDNNKSIRAS